MTSVGQIDPKKFVIECVNCSNSTGDSDHPIEIEVDGITFHTRVEIVCRSCDQGAELE